jgi:hypothetical protein
MRLNLRAVNFDSFRIQDIDHPSRTIPFSLNPPQQRALAKMIELQDKNRPIWTINLKARRVGFSTLYSILNSVHCVAFANANALTVAHRAKNAKAIFQAARNAHQTILGDFNIPYGDYRTQHELRFPHAEGESVLSLATAKTVEGARGLTLTALLLSEAAFYEQAEDAFTALLNTVVHQPQTIVSIESTANGKVDVGQAFYEHWMDAVEGKNDFTPIFIPWHLDPRNQRDPDMTDVKLTNLDAEEKELVKFHKCTYAQLSWRRWAIPNLCHDYVEVFHAEFPSTADEAFTVTGDPAFNSLEMKMAEDASRRKPIFRGDIENVGEAA